VGISNQRRQLYAAVQIDGDLSFKVNYCLSSNRWWGALFSTRMWNSSKTHRAFTLKLFSESELYSIATSMIDEI